MRTALPFVHARSFLGTSFVVTGAFVGLVALGALGACSSSKTAVPLLDDGTGADTGDASPGTTANDGDDSADGAARTNGDGGSDASAGNGGNVGDASSPGSGMDADRGDDAGDAMVLPPICSPTTTWGAGVLLGISTTADDRFGAITPDELTIAWTTPNDADAAAGGTVRWADRTSTDSAFTTPQTLTAIAASTVAYDAVALGSDGLTMMVVRSDHAGFIALTRATRTDAFGAPSETELSDVNPDRMEADTDTVADPVLAGPATELYYSDIARAGAAATASSLQSASRADATSRWLAQYNPPTTALAPSGGNLRRPTGLAVDQRTLFYWDEASSLERAAYRNATDQDFDLFVDVGPQMYAAPNASCRRIYYSMQNGASLDLYSADAN